MSYLARVNSEIKNEKKYPEFFYLSDSGQLKDALMEDIGLKDVYADLIEDEEFWSEFNPTGSEIYALLQKFPEETSGKSQKEALYLIRKFLRA